MQQDRVVRTLEREDRRALRVETGSDAATVWRMDCGGQEAVETWKGGDMEKEETQSGGAGVEENCPGWSKGPLQALP